MGEGRGTYNSVLRILSPTCFNAARRDCASSRRPQPARPRRLRAAARPGRRAWRRWSRRAAIRSSSICPAWYERLHEGVHGAAPRPQGRRRARARWTSCCVEADLLVTAQRPSALARLGLGARRARRAPPAPVPRRHHRPRRRRARSSPGHDLTYLAEAGAARAARAAADALRRHGRRRARGDHRARARDRARPRRARRARARAARRGGARALAAAAARGPHRARRAAGRRHSLATMSTRRAPAGSRSPRSSRTSRAALARGAGHAEPLDRRRCAQRFATEDAEHWEAWARAHDLPIVALRDPSHPKAAHADRRTTHSSSPAAAPASAPPPRACSSQAGGKVVIADVNDAGAALAQRAGRRVAASSRTDVTDEASTQAAVDLCVSRVRRDPRRDQLRRRGPRRARGRQGPARIRSRISSAR